MKDIKIKELEEKIKQLSINLMVCESEFHSDDVCFTIDGVKKLTGYINWDKYYDSYRSNKFKLYPVCSYNKSDDSYNYYDVPHEQLFRYDDEKYLDEYINGNKDIKRIMNIKRTRNETF